MDYYLIFDKSGTYLGYSKDETVINAFMEQRGKKNYSVKKIKKENMNQELLKTIEYGNQKNKGELTEYSVDDSAIPIFESEDIEFTTYLNESITLLSEILPKLSSNLKFVKFSDSERHTVEHAMRILDTIIWYVKGDEGCYENLAIYLKLDKLLKKYT